MIYLISNLRDVRASAVDKRDDFFLMESSVEG